MRLELRYILAAIDRTLANMFIETADEYGIKRYEDMMDIVPDEEDTLDTRRFRVLTLWNDYVPYTKSELYKRLVKQFGTTVNTLVALNGIKNKNLIYVGQVIKLP